MPLTAPGCLRATVVVSVCGSGNAGDPSGLDHLLKPGEHLLGMLVGTLDKALPTDVGGLPSVDRIYKNLPTHLGCL